MKDTRCDGIATFPGGRSGDCNKLLFRMAWREIKIRCHHCKKDHTVVMPSSWAST